MSEVNLEENCSYCGRECWEHVPIEWETCQAQFYNMQFSKVIAMSGLDKDEEFRSQINRLLNAYN